MLSKGWSNEILAERCERNDTNPSVFPALYPADQALGEEAVHGDTDRTWCQIDNRAYRIDWQRPFVEQGFQHAEIRETESGLFNPRGGVARQRTHRLHHHKPDVLRLLDTLGHKNLNLLKVYAINYIDVNLIDTMIHGGRRKENLMRTVSAIARYLAGVIFLVFGLNGFLNFIPLPPPGGIAGQFMGALYATHYLWVIFAFQLVAGVLLLVNRYVPLAVAMLAPVIVNILSFHVLMAPSGLPLALVVAILWAVIFVDVRSAFAALFQARVHARA